MHLRRLYDEADVLREIATCEMRDFDMIEVR
jgi:hypothetical protein